MDAVFNLDEAARSSFLQFLMRLTGCKYICLWLQQANCLIGLDGYYNDVNTIQPEALVLFIEYRQLIFPLENNLGTVPGFAFRNYSPYTELREQELQNRASHHTQRQFYRTAVFMGCRSGEIELGSPNELNMEMEMRSFFPEDFLRLSPVAIGNQLLQPTDPNRPSSSSSSLRSRSTGGSQDSYLMPTAAPSAPRPQVQTGETIPSSLLAKASSSSAYDPHQQAVQQALSELRSDIRLPTLESENAVMTKAILAVLTSPSSSCSSKSHQQNPKATAFKLYGSVVLSASQTTAARTSLRPQSMLKRAILFCRELDSVRRKQLPRSRPTANQLQHMFSERKRREKLNESFEALRSLLPPGTKRDRVSVLASSMEYLASLKAQIMELNRQNQSLQAHLSSDAAEEDNGSSNERINIRIIPESESTSQQRIIHMRITFRGENLITDILIQLLEFLKLDRNTTLMSTESDTRITELGSVNHVNVNDWDEATFREAIRRILADLAR
ncbi:Alpha/beta-Hydrolases superfamily protein [Hibiscus syriacus]|uniref:Alpha/beta-Hydrolases superfamily protein n=1 Tax=Hibiscus syriacus TaxID=106335 RepID=A0A6A3A7K0_HIBSY|nr:Alpha/beta-Hydrolases superfamily protein [Hibiscus syriacus]